MFAVAHYLSVKPAGLVIVWLVIAIICFAVAGLASITPGKFWPLFMAAGLLFVVLAFLT